MDDEAGNVRSRRIFAGTGATMVLLSMDAGENLKEHIATTPIVIQVLLGHAAIDVGSERVDLPTGAIIHLAASLPHAVEALTQSHLLLTLLERGRSDPADAKALTKRAGRASHIVLATSGADSVRISHHIRSHDDDVLPVLAGTAGTPRSRPPPEQRRPAAGHQPGPG